VIRPNLKSAYIEIQKSLSYSIGYGPYPVVWISGAAGWFEISPAPRYRKIYDEMCDAVTLYYKVMDAYEPYNKAKLDYETATAKRRRKMKPPGPVTLDQVFLKVGIICRRLSQGMDG
jgi:hypothetical protein